MQLQNSDRVALIAPGRSLTYGQLRDESASLAAVLRQPPAGDLDRARVAFLVAAGVDYTISQWAIWQAGGVAVPLSASQASAEWDYIISDTEAGVILSDAAHAPGLRALPSARGVPFVEFEDAARRPRLAPSPGGRPPAFTPPPGRDRPAMILYTSGTTSRPKGVVLTGRNLEAQMDALIGAWGWTPADRVLHVLPLHHVHGIVNVLGCALRAGATCEFLSRFDAAAVWERFASRELSLFMAVPTIYVRLLAAWDAADPATRARWGRGAGSLRLMVSGSAALPVAVLERWQAATGHVLLERYGMTEIGMALSNPLEGPRRPGHVGRPLPGVEVRLVDEQGAVVADGIAGEIEVRGPSVFAGYWRRPDATRAAFREGWFRTGDVAVVEEGSYRILGRRSVDIIKSGGFKISALEVEDVLLGHPAIRECAVVGVPDAEWGQRVAAVVVLAPGASLDLAALRAWASARLAKYKLPTILRVTDALPRNAMGKVEKKTLYNAPPGEESAFGEGQGQGPGQG